MDVGPMTMHALPRKPYDEVGSEFTRDEIRQGSFDDLEYRRYVNELVWLEWCTNEGVGPNTSGISALGISVHRWKLAAAYPRAYDAIRQDLGASTRAEGQMGWRGEEDPKERRRWARRHHEEWQAVQEGEQRSPEARTELTTSGYRSFAPFRFPVLPYDSIQAPFIREEIQLGSFDDLEHRRCVNKLAWIEWHATAQDGGGLGIPVKHWRLAAEHPKEYDIVRRELGKETRDAIELAGEIYFGDIDAESAAREHKRAWRAIQEEGQ